MAEPSEHELYRLFDRSPIGMYRSTADGQFLYVNPALVRMLGYDHVDEVLAINLNRDVYDDPNERARVIAKYRPAGVIDGVEVHWHTRGGEPLTVRIYGHVVEAETGVTFDASVVDVTEVELTNHALRLQREELEAANTELRLQREELERTASTLDLVVQQMPALYWLVDEDLRIVRTGGAIAQLLGYPANKYVGYTLEESHRVEAGTVDPIQTHRRALAGETVIYTTEYRGKHLATTVAPFRRGGSIVGAIGTSFDVTALRALELRMVDAQRAESLGVLAGGLAHDFNNLLVAILGNADLALREVPPAAPGHAALDNIRRAGLRAAELTDQLLAYAGRGGVASTRVLPRPLVEELIAISAPTIPTNVRVDVDVPADLAMCGDPGQIRQVILNLIANARDALGEREGTIAVTGRPIHHDSSPDLDDIVTAPAGDYVQIIVADNGPGMEPDMRRRIFEPFFTTKSTGHGLGLAAVLGIVRAHGGGLRLVSSPGDGARFELLWPASPASAGRSETDLPAARTVLVIDDEDLVRDVVARMIEDLGYAAVTAADGPTGLAIISSTHVDAVLVDMTMPRMSGVDVIAALRKLSPALPIVLCSGYDRDRRGPVTADAYLPKPFRIEALEQTLAKLLPR